MELDPETNELRELSRLPSGGKVGGFVSDDSSNSAFLPISHLIPSVVNLRLCVCVCVWVWQGPCHVCVDADTCFVTNYETGHITACAVNKQSATFLQPPISTTRVGPAEYTNQVCACVRCVCFLLSVLCL